MSSPLVSFSSPPPQVFLKGSRMSEDVDLRRPEIIGIDNSLNPPCLFEDISPKRQNSGAGSELVRDTQAKVMLVRGGAGVFNLIH